MDSECVKERNSSRDQLFTRTQTGASEQSMFRKHTQHTGFERAFTAFEKIMDSDDELSLDDSSMQVDIKLEELLESIIKEQEEGCSDSDDSQLLLFKIVELIQFRTGVFVFDLNDIKLLREKYRIVGTLCGPVQSLPSHTRSAPPLQLRKEEVRLLVEKGYAKIVSQCKSDLISKEDKSNALETFQRRIHEFSSIDRFREKLESLCLPRPGSKRLKHRLIEPASVPYSAPEFNKKDPITVQLVDTPFRCYNNIDPSFHEGEDAMSMLRFRVFRDLWEKGNFITGASNFASDFLVYKDDPSLCHAHACVYCIPHNKSLKAADIIRYCRIGSSIKKMIVLASTEKGELKYITLAWQA